jgi:hypothetical protein
MDEKCIKVDEKCTTMDFKNGTKADGKCTKVY